jgi:hypothetical protein
MKLDHLSLCCTVNIGEDLLRLFALHCELWNNIWGLLFFTVQTHLKYRRVYLELLPDAEIEAHGEIYLRF